MITAFIDGLEIIPFDSIEFTSHHDSGHTDQIIVHMSDSRKEHVLAPEQSERFISEYVVWLELREAMMGIVDSESEPESTGPIKKDVTNLAGEKVGSITTR